MTEAPDAEDLGPVVRSAMLLTASRPGLYRANAFRVTGLPVTATLREIERHAEKLRLAERLGTSPQVVRLLPLNPAPDGEAFREAHQQLREPEKRLIDELFWFWPLAGHESDEALSCLYRGDVDGAIDIWRALEDSETGVIARHNLAVLWHALALDAELEAMGGTLAPEQRHQRDLYWSLALTAWARLTEQEPLWDRVRSRVRELDDPRLTEDTVTGLRGTLPIAVLAILGELAARSAGAGDLDEARRLARLIEGSGFPARAVQEAQIHAATPLRNRIFALCEAAERETDADPQHADRVTEQLSAQTGPLLDAIDELLAERHPVREAIHDQVALRLLECQLAYGNRVEDWQRSLKLLQPALRVAASTTARGRIRQNLEIVENNLAVDLHNRIVALCERALAEATAGPKHADRIAERLLAETQSLLDTLDGSVTNGNPVREAAHDAVALQVLACHIQYCDTTQDWKRSIPPLRQTLAIAAGAEARKHIQRNLEALDRALVLTQCFFCADPGPYHHDDLEVSFYRVTGQKTTVRGTIIEGQRCSVHVPRCRACKIVHGRSKMVMSIGIVLGALAGLIAFVTDTGDNGCAFFLLFIVLVAAGAGIGKIIGVACRSKIVKPTSAARQYAPVSSLLAEGWSLGTELPQ